MRARTSCTTSKSELRIFKTILGTCGVFYWNLQARMRTIYYWFTTLKLFLSDNTRLRPRRNSQNDWSGYPKACKKVQLFLHHVLRSRLAYSRRRQCLKMSAQKNRGTKWDARLIIPCLFLEQMPTRAARLKTKRRGTPQRLSKRKKSKRTTTLFHLCILPNDPFFGHFNKTFIVLNYNWIGQRSLLEFKQNRLTFKNSHLAVLTLKKAVRMFLITLHCQIGWAKSFLGWNSEGPSALELFSYNALLCR